VSGKCQPNIILKLHETFSQVNMVNMQNKYITNMVIIVHRNVSLRFEDAD